MDTFVGVDVHKSFSQVHVQSQDGNPVAEGHLEHDDLEGLRRPAAVLVSRRRLERHFGLT